MSICSFQIKNPLKFKIILAKFSKSVKIEHNKSVKNVSQSNIVSILALVLVKKNSYSYPALPAYPTGHQHSLQDNCREIIKQYLLTYLFQHVAEVISKLDCSDILASDSGQNIWLGMVITAA